MTLTSEITLHFIALNGVRFKHGEPLETYTKVLGPPTRADDSGPPPPYGYRNNVIHYYDHFGILLREHHASRLIQGIDILLEPPRWHFQTILPYSGELLVFGVNIIAEMEIADFARQSTVKLQPHLGHAWYVDGEKLSIQLEVYSPDKKHRAQGLISAVLVGFVGAHQPNRKSGKSQ